MADKDKDKDPKPDTGKPAAGEPDSTDWKTEAEKWKGLSRKHEDQAKTNADAAQKLKDLEDADKSEIQKAADAAAAATKRAEEAELRAMRAEVAADKGLTASQAKRLVGTTIEELQKDADDLLTDFGGGAAGDSKTADGKGAAAAATTATRPKEQLRGGGDPTFEPEETDPRKLAAQVPRM